MFINNLIFSKKLPPKPKIQIEQFIGDELTKIKTDFYISRTGVEMIDLRRDNPLPENNELPTIFLEVYEPNRKTNEEYDKLDAELNHAREISTSINDFYNNAKKLHYANCTSLACFLCGNLNRNGFEAKVFGFSAEHHFVIAKSDDPGRIIVIDPWAGVQFDVMLDKTDADVVNLENLSMDARIKIMRVHFQYSNLYPESAYQPALDAILGGNMLPQYELTCLKGVLSISPVERYLEFDHKPNITFDI